MNTRKSITKSLALVSVLYVCGSMYCYAEDVVPVPVSGSAPVEPTGSYTQTTTVHEETVKPHHHHGLVPETVGVTGKAVKETVGLPFKITKETLKALF